ncbi:Cof-type HAD-IIB family hydrolase [Bacillus altitudinis MN12]|uniref:Cof-type HAD-IIB family hydrolase n=2 Tax=Bacillus TaxID=1386 RepID=A0ABV1S2Y8_BACAB|nr:MULTISPECIES: Cof-type HAD-IIB family hydrolase [Bacillus]AHL70939.1 phosphatase [Bacillus pumilus]KML02121.1 phosphatase [Bacillus stratosphericus]MBW3700059.1 Cof-type HAD-IIB family hydrolase [Bacillus aerophilus]MDH8709827.1 Cof subfamily protein (haloacid dehalogenase superfamily) [Micromonospora sp. 1209]AKU31830.1 phosphatase [Bacillus altitudinis]
METKPYLIALDLDGTLLKDDKTISAHTLDVIQKVKDSGHHVCISTGRPFRSSSPYYQQLQLDSPIVNFNGAFVHHPLDEKWGRFHTSLDLQVVKQLVDISEEYKVHNVLAEVLDDLYFHYHDEKLIDIFNMNANKVTVGDLRNNLGENVTSVLIHAKEEDVGAIRSYLTDVHAEVIDHRRWAAPWHVIEIIKTGMNKAVGLQKISDYYGVPQERIVAFGDEDNDLEMLEFAGCGVAMGNGIDAVKRVSNEVTDTNEQDGIAKFLTNYFSL